MSQSLFVSTSRRLKSLGLNAPSAVIHERQVHANIARMAGVAHCHNVTFRPHFKTHQSGGVGVMFQDRDVTRITVSSVSMAEYFAEYGWADILLAFLPNILLIHRLNDLADRVQLGLLLDSPDLADWLGSRLASAVSVWIKIDPEYGRTGIPWNRPDDVIALTRRIAQHDKLRFRGLLTHSGQTYSAGSPDAVRRIQDETIDRLHGLQDRILRDGAVPLCGLSIGDTPGCSLSTNFSHVEEIRPGNFVFYDLQQAALGSCTPQEIAAGVACPVVGIYSARGEIVVHGGAVHLSREYILEGGSAVFGRLAVMNGDGPFELLPETAVTRLSQEHGIIRVSPEIMDRVRPGDMVLVLPVHACLTFNLYRHYTNLYGDVINRL